MKLGYELKTGSPVDIPITHTVFSALTGGGKTEAVLRCIEEAKQAGYTVLAIDVKAKPRDFEGIGTEVPPILLESTEPLLVLRMLESVANVGLFKKFSTLLDACMDTKTLTDVMHNLEAIRDNKKASSWRRDDAKVLAHLLGLLLEQIHEGEYVDSLDMVGKGVYVMNISNLPTGIQQLVVDSVFREALTFGKNMVIVLEEAINFIPQAESTTFETSARKFIREGRSAGLFLWVSGQALTEMDIAVRKQMRVWVLGGQMEEREAEKFRKQVPMKGVDAAEIKKLPTGHFICAVRRAEEEGGHVEVLRVYAQPTWLPDDVAIAIAKGKASLKDAMKHKQVRQQGRAKHVDEEERKHLKGEIQKWMDKAEGLDTDVKRLEKKLEERDFDVKTLQEEMQRLKATRQVIAQEVIRENLGEVFPDLPQPKTRTQVPTIVEGDLDLDTLAAKVADMVEPRILAKLPRGSVVEVPPKRVILSTFLEAHVKRVQEPLAKLPDRAKRYLAFLSTKEGYQGTKSVAIALFGYGSDAASIAKALADVGAADYDSQHGRVRYALLETLKKDIQGQYEITDEELAQIHANLQLEFLGMLKGGA